jgi:hypothetical protein
MITDLFSKRYQNRPVLMSAEVPPTIQRFLVQAVQIFYNDIASALDLSQSFFQRAHDAFVRELGTGRLGATQYHEICAAYLSEPYNLWNDGHGSADTFFKLRISLLELLFRQAEDLIAASKPLPKGIVFRTPPVGVVGSHGREAFKRGVEELNRRFREASIPLEYHRGVIQFASDALTENELSTPFWEVLRDPKWVNVETDIKEAINRRDTSSRDAPFYAMRALESAIKIISDEKGWTTGQEKGASNYIDNLASKGHGHYIDEWEAEALRLLFSKIRNPHGHGPGSAPPPALTERQTTWVIEACMSWIKSLIDR